MKEQGKGSLLSRAVGNTNEDFGGARTMERIRHLHNELLLAAMVLFFLITCTLQTTYTLLHDQIQDRRG